MGTCKICLSLRHRNKIQAKPPLQTQNKKERRIVHPSETDSMKQETEKEKEIPLAAAEAFI